MQEATRMEGKYNLLAAKATLFLSVVTVELYDPGLPLRILLYPVGPAQVYQLIWFGLVVMMLRFIVPAFNPDLDSGKIFAKNYAPSRAKLRDRKRMLAEYTRRSDRGALKSALLWLAIFAVVAALWYAGMYGVNAMLAVFTFFVMADEYCIVAWCPFRALIGNRCCNVCRITNWAYIMLFSLLVFFPSFWAWSLIALALAALIQWEWVHWRHPERFYELCNENLQCSKCRHRVKNCAKK